MHTRFQLHISSYVIAVVLGSVAAPARGQIGLGLSPVRVSLDLTRIPSHSDSLVLSNESATAVNVRAELLDFYIDDEQEPQFGSFARERQSCRTFLRLNPTEFELQPHTQMLVRYTLRLPVEPAPGSYYCAAGFTTAPIRSLSESGLAINVRAISSFYVNVGTPELKGSLRRLLVESSPHDSATSQRVVCVVENSGIFVWRPQGSLEVRRASGEVVQSIPFRSLPALPEREQRYIFPLARALNSGEELRVRLDIGDGEIQEARVPVSLRDP